MGSRVSRRAFKRSREIIVMSEDNDAYSERKRSLREMVESLPYEKQEQFVSTFIHFSGISMEISKKIDALFAEIRSSKDLPFALIPAKEGNLVRSVYSITGEFVGFPEAIGDGVGRCPVVPCKALGGGKALEGGRIGGKAGLGGQGEGGG